MQIETKLADLEAAATDARSAVQAFLDMVTVIQRFGALPIPAILETAQHNCPLILDALDRALAKEKNNVKQPDQRTAKTYEQGLEDAAKVAVDKLKWLGDNTQADIVFDAIRALAKGDV